MKKKMNFPIIRRKNEHFIFVWNSGSKENRGEKNLTNGIKNLAIGKKKYTKKKKGKRKNAKTWNELRYEAYDFNIRKKLSIKEIEIHKKRKGKKREEKYQSRCRVADSSIFFPSSYW